ncbi:hypothetical protein [Bradyrhizobium sp. 174]|jgi:hypothetical protein|uniref:hypothetical protein n=1 Tax=Bradyrhizobium sp. 174 TaxID=2782645 RepID=UPI001FFAA96F|nr:hypothetical protein [Bradyrhizobium sp. 174]MCK1576828.1 hypothetical protein [Bradyrhizobium sp. 174]
MKKSATLIREIEINTNKLALLQRDHARIGQEISDLAASNKAKIIELIGTTVENMDLSQVPIHLLVSRVSKLGEGLIQEDRVSEDDTTVFVKFGRNASSANRQVLVSAGLHWHGRDGGWVGRVTEAQLASLRKTFGDRVSASKGEDAGDPLGEPPVGAPDEVSADVAAIVPSVEADEGHGQRAADQVQPASSLVRPSFSFPPRRPAQL